MLKTFYIQVDEVNKITDIIEFPHEDYKEIQLNTPLPHNIMSGSYKLTDDGVIYIKEWDNSELINKISILTEENAELLLDSVNKDIKLKSLEKDLADLTLIVGGI